MTIKIGLISDVHAAVGPLRAALALLQDEGVHMILCAGDIAGYGTELAQTVALLRAGSCRAILGNHDVWYLQGAETESAGPETDYLAALPAVIELSVAETSIYMVHASPPASLQEGIRLLDQDGVAIPEEVERWRENLRDFPCHVLIVGHTHQVFAQRLGKVLVVNPGSTRFNHTCAVLTLPQREVRILPLPGQTPVPAWNWGLEGLGRSRVGTDGSGEP